MRFISLFAGIGGMDLGLERAGMTCVAQVEIDEYCRKVLTKHWPEVPKYGDIKTVRGDELPYADLVAGGFPCTDISNAGKGAGIEGERSGLWREFARLVGEIRPQFVLVENVAALLNRGLDRVLGDLAACGYDAEWQCLSASDFGAWHQRSRLFIVGYRRWEPVRFACDFPECDCCGEPYCERHECHWWECNCPGPSSDTEDGWDLREEPWGLVAYPALLGVQVDGATGQQEPLASPEPMVFRRGFSGSISGEWESEPAVDRVVHGSPEWVDGIKGLGNAVVPAVAQFIGERIMEGGTP